MSESVVNRTAKPYDLIINVPPGSTKSTICTIMYPAWLWTLDPSLTIITNSYSSDLSREHAVKSRDIIQCAKYKRLFNYVEIRRDKSGKEHYENTAKGARVTTSTGSTITGFHANVIISDDPLNPSQAASDADRKTANEHTKTLSSRKRDKANTPTILVMQRLHEDDVTGFLLKKKGDKIKHICLPSEVSKRVNPPELAEKYVNGLLDPLRLSAEILAEAKVDLGSMGYANQHDQSPSPAGGNIIKSDWFQTIPLSAFEAIRTNEPIQFWIDTAFSERAKKTDNDPTGIIAACKIRNNVYILKAKKVWKNAPELLTFIKEFTKENGYSEGGSIRIEPKANGKTIVQLLRHETGLNVVESPAPKDDKRTRLNSIAAKVEAGRVYLVEDSWNDDFKDEICGFPNRSHDEYVDVLVEAVRHFLITVTDESDIYDINSMLA